MEDRIVPPSVISMIPNRARCHHPARQPNRLVSVSKSQATTIGMSVSSGQVTSWGTYTGHIRTQCNTAALRAHQPLHPKEFGEPCGM